MTTGANSHFALTKLASKYVQMQEDGRVLSNKASIQVIDDRIVQLLERIDMNEAPDRLARLQLLWKEMRDAEKLGNKGDALAKAMEIDQEFEAAYHDYAAWKQMFEALDLRRKLSESEVKIAKDIQAILTAEDVYELAAKLLAAIITSVNGMVEIPALLRGRLLKRVQYEFTRIMGTGDRKRAGGGEREIIDPESSELDPEGVPGP